MNKKRHQGNRHQGTKGGAIGASHRGVALILVMIALVMGTVLAVSFLSQQTTATAVASNVSAHAEARAIAESALVSVIEHVRSDADWRDTLSNGQWASDAAFAGGTYSVWGVDGYDENGDGVIDGDETDGDLSDDAGDRVTITVIANFNGVTHRVQSVVTPGDDSLAVLMVVNDADNLNSQDQAKTSLFQGWGWSVTHLSADALQSEYDTAVATHDAAYVSEDVSSSQVGSKLTGAAIGVVTEEGYLFDDLLIASSAGGEFWDDAIDIVDNSHYITSPFATGPLTIGGGNVHCHVVQGTLAPGADVLAEREGSSSPMLVTLEAGASQYGGGGSAGRRVALPFGGGSFDIGDLNDDGKTILKRAVVWASVSPQYEAGLEAEHFISGSSPSVLADINWSATPDYEELVDQINYPSTSGSFYSGGPTDDFGVRFTGKIDIPTGGTWTFYLNSDDGSDLMIDGATVVNNDGLHGMTEQSGSLSLDAGLHDITARVFERGGGAGIILSWAGPGVSKQVVPASAFSHTAGGDPEEEDEEPNLVALYEFVEPDTQPTLVGHWKLDEPAPISGMTLADELEMYGNADIDSYDSSLGSYGGGNVGSDAEVSTNSTSADRIWLHDGNNDIDGDVYVGAGGSPSHVIQLDGGASINGSTGALSANIVMPTNAWPTGMPAQSGDLTSSATLSSDRRYDNIDLSGIDNLVIDGNVRIQVDGDFTMSGIAQISLNAGSTLEIWIGGDFSMTGIANFNQTSGDPSAVTIYGMTNLDMDLDGNSQLYARIIHPTGDVDMVGSGVDVFGTIIADDVYMDDAQFHMDVSVIVGADPAADETDTENDGSYVGATPGASGRDGTAASFDGSDDYVEIAHDSSYLLDTGSLSLHFKADDVSGQQVIFSKDSSGYDNGGHLTVYLDGSTLTAQLQSTTTSYTVEKYAIAAGTWYHVVFEWGAQGMKLYVNGSPADTDPYTGGLGDTSGGSGNTEPIALGAGTWNSGDGVVTPVDDFFDGTIDDVRLYDGLLDQGQITNLASVADPGQRTAPSYVVEDTSGYGSALNLYIEDTDDVAWVPGGGLTFNANTVARQLEANTKIADTLAATDTLTIELIFTPSTVTTSGGEPKAIASYANGATVRNFTVGQSDADYSAMLRTGDTGTGGTPDLDAGATMVADAQQHVLVTYDGETFRLYRGGNLDSSVDRTGDLDNWDTSYPFTLGNEFTLDRGFLGTLSRVAIYDQALDAGQRSNVFNGEAPGAPGQASGAFNTRWVEP